MQLQDNPDGSTEFHQIGCTIELMTFCCSGELKLNKVDDLFRKLSFRQAMSVEKTARHRGTSKMFYCASKRPQPPLDKCIII